jgi:hypothetical protein
MEAKGHRPGALRAGKSNGVCLRYILKWSAFHQHAFQMSLIQLIYVSSTTTELEAGEIRRILDSSVRHNTPQKVTGLLLYTHGSFMQVLEGEEVAVDETMSRILADERHHSINVLARTTIPTREFGSWSMGFRGVTAPDAETWPAYAPFFEFGFNSGQIGATPGVALEILQAMANAI